VKKQPTGVGWGREGLSPIKLRRGAQDEEGQEVGAPGATLGAEDHCKQEREGAESTAAGMGAQTSGVPSPSWCAHGLGPVNSNADSVQVSSGPRTAVGTATAGQGKSPQQAGKGTTAAKRKAPSGPHASLPQEAPQHSARTDFQDDCIPQPPEVAVPAAALSSIKHLNVLQCVTF